MKHLPDHPVSTAAQRVKYIRKANKISQIEMSKIMGVSQSTLSQVENGNYDISFDSIKKISKKFNIDCNWLIMGKGDMFITAESEKKEEKEKSEDARLVGEQGIPLVAGEAIAGYIESKGSNDFVSTLDTYRLPNFNDDRERRIFEMPDKSMMPIFREGDYLVAGRQQDSAPLPNGTLAVVINGKNLYVSRLYKYAERENYYVLKQENGATEANIIAKSDIEEVWEISGRITRHADEKFLRNDADSIEIMKRDLDDLKNKIHFLLKGQ